MPGTKAGAKKAIKTKLAKYGKNHFKEIGKKGGNPALLSIKEKK